MRWSVVIGAVGFAVIASAGAGHAQSAASRTTTDRMNRMIPLIEQGLPILGLNNPAYAAGRGGRGQGAGGGRGGRGGRGAGAADGAASAAAAPTPAPDIDAVARETAGYMLGDYVLNTYSPASVEQYRTYMMAIVAAGGSARTHPFAAKIPIMHDNVASTTQRMIDQLNDGQVMVVMQEVETTEEIDQAIAGMRFTSKGGSRPESGFERAAAYWGMTPAQYMQKADVWPLNRNGELLINIIIESREGVANARALSAHPAAAVVTVGAGTLGGVFTSTNAEGQRVRDQVGFDAAVASILAACKEAKKSCGYPANNPAEVEKLMKDGWDFLIMQRRDQAAFDAVLTGRRLSERPLTP
ncbi:MAG: aldolase/citrate lyase family protein [Gemmatimonadetes bacterium]|nr:aldolase/citrate lyase family protein [Gemmatimonadota bacterium]